MAKTPTGLGISSTTPPTAWRRWSPTRLLDLSRGELSWNSMDRRNGYHGDWWRFIGENSWDSWGFLLINKDSWGLMNGGYWWLYVAMASA